MGGRCVRYGWIGGRREKIRGRGPNRPVVKKGKIMFSLSRLFFFAGRRRDVTKIQRVSHYVATLAFSAIVRGALKLADVFRIALQAPSEL